MMDRLVIFGLVLSGISFVMFFVSLLVHLFHKPAPAQVGGLGTAEQQGGISDFAKLFEAFSKLADSLNHSSPVVISLMASIIFFALALLGAGLGATKQKEDKGNEDKKDKVSMSTSVCVFSPFDVGKHELSEAVVAELNRSSEDCGASLVKRISSSSTSLVLLVGHSDRRKLHGRQSLDYGTNETLAYQRALALKKALLAKYVPTPTPTQSVSSSEFARRIIIVEGGPSFLERTTSEPQLAEDRSVDVISIGLASSASAAQLSRE